MGLRHVSRLLAAILAAGLVMVGASPATTALPTPGSPDPGFAQTSTGLDAAVNDIAVQSDGKVLLGGAFQRFLDAAAPHVVRLNPDGTRDTGFAQQGTGLNGVVLAVAVQSDGKIILGGEFDSYNGTPAGRVIRLNPDGTRDPSFASGSGPDTNVEDIVVLPDDKILLGGWFSNYDGSPAPHLIRLNSDGTRDNTFKQTGTGINGGVLALAVQNTGEILAGGVFSTYNGAAAQNLVRLKAGGARDNTFAQTGTGLDQSVEALAIQADGKILAGGQFTTYNGVAASRLIRLTKTGTRDNTFATFALTGTGFDERVQSLAVKDGKVLVGGRFTQYGDTSAPRLIRLNSNGTRDNTFAQTGTGLNLNVEAVVVQPDGRILSGGDFTAYGTAAALRVIRLNADGTHDGAFSQTGNGLDNPVQALVVQADGKILAGGAFTHLGAADAQHLVRLNPDGSRDPTFQQTGSGIDGQQVLAIAVQTDGRILAGGDFTKYNGVTARGLVRLNPDGSRDATFSLPGTGFGDGTVFAVAVQPDGKILVGGDFTKLNGATAPRVVRLNPDGTRDTSFSPSGSGFTGFYTSKVEAIAVQPDAKILVGGTFETYNGTSARYVMRFNSDGTRDNSFEQTGAGIDGYSVSGIHLRPDGKILVSGEIQGYNGDSGVAGILLLNPGGSLDPSFRQSDNRFEYIAGSAVQPDGKVVIIGGFEDADGVPMGAARLNTDGSLDKGFSTGRGTNGSVFAVALQSDGMILVGGFFTVFDDKPFAYVTRLVGGPGALTANPGALTFGELRAGTVSAAQTVTLTNSGDATVMFDAVVLAGADPGQYSLGENTCTGNLRPGTSCRISVAFAPKDNGTKSATVQITSSATGSPMLIGLQGNSPAKPGKPGKVKVKATTKKVSGRWAAVPGATSYSVQVKGTSRKGKKLNKSKSTAGTSTKIALKLKKKSKVTVCVVSANVSGTSAKACRSAKVT